MADKELSVRLTADTGSFERRMSTAASRVEALEKRLSGIVTQQELVQKAMSRARQSEVQSILVPSSTKMALNQELEAQRKIAAEQQRQAEQKLAMDNMVARNTEIQLEEQAAALRKLGAEQQRQVEEYLADLARVDAAKAQTRQKEWAAFQREQAQYEQQVAKEQRLKQLELDKERIRQQSLKTLGAGDLAAQRLRAAAEQTKREEYERWWIEQDITGELLKQKGIFGKMAYHVRNLGSTMSTWVTKANQILNKSRSTHSIYGGIWRFVRQIGSVLFGLTTVKIAIQGADTLVGAQNKLNNIAVQTLGDSAYQTDSKGNVTGYSQKALNFTKDAMDKIYVAAQNSRSAYDEMAANVSKVMTLSGDAFDNNVDNAIRFQETMAKAYAVGGATSSEMHNSMTQLTQALGAGILAGDELRSVREGAPLAYQAIEEFAQGVLKTDESLKELAADGKITSDMVVAAVMNMSDSIDQQFALTKWRFSEVWESTKNSAKKAFEPVITMMTDMLNAAVDDGLIQDAEQLFTKVAKAVMIVFTALKNAVIWVRNNWDTVVDVIVGGLMLMLGWTITKAVVGVAAAFMEWKANIIAAYGTMSAWWKANLVMMKVTATIIVVALAVIALAYVFYLWKTAAIDTCQAITYALIIVGLAALLIGLIFWSIPIIIAGAIILAIAIIWKFFDTVCGVVALIGAVVWNGIIMLWNILVEFINFVVGLIFWAGATVLNLFIAVINALLQAAWSVADPFIGIIEWILNACNGGFNSFGGAVANLIGQIISWFLSLGKVVTKIIDAIFGTNWTSGLQALQDKVLDWGKKEDESITISRNVPGVKRIDASNAFNVGANLFGYAEPLDASNAFQSGKDWGAGIKDSVNAWGAKFQIQQNEEAKKTSMLDMIGDKLGLTDVFANMGDFPTEGVGTPDPDYKKLLDSINGNTGTMADSMDLTEEDLDYLRRIADMEWKKEYTVAEIKVDMTNNNTVDKDFDLHSLAIGLRDLVEEEMFAVADGVYAY